MMAGLFFWRRQSAHPITYAHAQARVAAGARYLDDVDPGWHARIDAETLALADGTCCVLGQLHGDFRRGLLRARLLDFSSAPRANLMPWRFGFQCEPGLDPASQDRDYAFLDRAWRVLILERNRTDAPRHVSVDEGELVLA